MGENRIENFQGSYKFSLGKRDRFSDYRRRDGIGKAACAMEKLNQRMKGVVQ